MRAILIDAKNRTVNEIDIERGLPAMYAAIGCDLVELVRMGDGYDLWIDEEGAINGTDYGFIFGSQYCGNGLLLDSDDDGECQPSTASLAFVRACVAFTVSREIAEAL